MLLGSALDRKRINREHGRRHMRCPRGSLESPEGIPTNILADRLKRLELIDVVTKQKYSDHARRFEYGLTQRGLDLWPVVQEMAKWGQAHMADAREPGEWFWANQ